MKWGRGNLIHKSSPIFTNPIGGDLCWFVDDGKCCQYPMLPVSILNACSSKHFSVEHYRSAKILHLRPQTGQRLRDFFERRVCMVSSSSPYWFLLKSAFSTIAPLGFKANLSILLSVIRYLRMRCGKHIMEYRMTFVIYKMLKPFATHTYARSLWKMKNG